MSKSGDELFSEGKGGPVECLGMTFKSDDARQEYFTQKLKERLADPEFRKIPGFPKGRDEDILRMSDPPYYTACPNPFLLDFVRVHGKPFNPDEAYGREPFAVDVSVGKTGQLYKAHGYHTKVPHLAIVPSILHYTEPGDIVLDGFCGSGMTGMAAQWCGSAPPTYRRTLEEEWRKEGRPKPKWGTRRAVLGDLSPAATFIAAGYNLPVDVRAFDKAAKHILSEVEAELGWMYQTLHTDGATKGRINYTVWSEVFVCPECGQEVVFVNEAMDLETKKTMSTFACPHCAVILSKKSVQRSLETKLDPVSQKPWQRIRLRPVLLNYEVDGVRFEKRPDEEDLQILERIDSLPIPPEVPNNPFPIGTMYHGSRLAPKGFTHVHHVYLPRACQALALMWRKANSNEVPAVSRFLKFWVEQAVWNLAVMNAYRPTGFSQNSQWFKGVYYVPSQHSECSPWYVLDGKRKRLSKVFAERPTKIGNVHAATADCGAISAPASSPKTSEDRPPHLSI